MKFYKVLVFKDSTKDIFIPDKNDKNGDGEDYTIIERTYSEKWIDNSNINNLEGLNIVKLLPGSDGLSVKGESQFDDALRNIIISRGGH